MKRLFAAFLCCIAVSAALSGCTLISTGVAPTHVGTEEPVLSPVVVATLATPAPTPAPRVLTYALSGTLFSRSGMQATVTGISYTENQTVTATVDIENLSSYPLTLSARVPGAVNGWSIDFFTDSLASENEQSTVAPASTVTLSLTASLNAGAAERMQLLDIQTLSLSFTGMRGEEAFEPGASIIQNPGCEAGYVQTYSEDAPLLLQSSRARYYFAGLDPVTATLYVTAENLGAPFQLLAIPRINGYALGTGGSSAAFALNATHVMLAVPLLETVQSFAISSIRDLSLSAIVSQQGRIVDAEPFDVLLGGEVPVQSVANENAAADSPMPEPPAYIGTGRTFYQNDDIRIYYETCEAEPSDYYGKITRYSLVCMNNTASVLLPNATLIKLAGAVMEGGFTGCLPPCSQTRFDFSVYSNVNKGAGVTVAMELLDCSAKLRKLVSEEIAFTS